MQLTFTSLERCTVDGAHSGKFLSFFFYFSFCLILRFFFFLNKQFKFFCQFYYNIRKSILINHIFEYIFLYIKRYLFIFFKLLILMITFEISESPGNKIQTVYQLSKKLPVITGELAFLIINIIHEVYIVCSFEYIKFLK